MLQRYTVAHGPSGRSVTVLAYTPEEAQRKALAGPLARAVSAAPAAARAAQPAASQPPHQDNVTVSDARGVAQKSKKPKG